MVGVREGLHREHPWTEWAGSAEATRASREGPVRCAKALLSPSSEIKMHI